MRRAMIGVLMLAAIGCGGRGETVNLNDVVRGHLADAREKEARGDMKGSLKAADDAVFYSGAESMTEIHAVAVELRDRLKGVVAAGK